MGYVCKFLDNESYSAQDVNDAFARLTTEGVSLFTDSGNTLEDLNTAISELTDAGVDSFNADACRVTRAEGTYKLMPGTAFMPDGSMIIIDGDGEELEIPGSKMSYICFYRNSAKNTIEISVSSDDVLYSRANSVPLAVIGANGEITDTRIFAKSKLAPCSGNTYRILDESFLLEKGSGIMFVTKDYGMPFSYFAMPEKGVIAQINSTGYTDVPGTNFSIRFEQQGSRLTGYYTLYGTAQSRLCAPITFL